jgi:hypothetical protein
MDRTSHSGSVSLTHELRTGSWTADVRAIEAAVERFDAQRPLTNESKIACFEIVRDARLHVNVTHRYPTKDVRGWAGPGTIADGFVYNRTFGDTPPSVIARHIRAMVFAART